MLRACGGAALPAESLPAGGAPELRPSGWLSFPRPSARRDTRPDGVPSCLYSPCPLLSTVLPVPSSPTKGVGPARAESSRHDVHIQVQLCVAIAVPGAGRRGRAGHQHQSAALRGSVEAPVREIVGQVVPAVSFVPESWETSPPREGAPSLRTPPTHPVTAQSQPSTVTLTCPASFSLCCPSPGRCDFNWSLELIWNHWQVDAGNSLWNEPSPKSQEARLHVGWRLRLSWAEGEIPSQSDSPETSTANSIPSSRL